MNPRLNDNDRALLDQRDFEREAHLPFGYFDGKGRRAWIHDALLLLGVVGLITLAYWAV